FADVRARLLAARARRPQPARDEKVVTGWNALAVTALAEAGAALGRPEWVELAVDVLAEISTRHIVDGRLRRSSLGGVVGAPLAALDDHGALATALLTVYQVTGEYSWCAQALDLLDRTIDTFADPAAPGTWFDSAEDSLIARPRDPADGATPSGAALIAEALLIASTLAPVERSARYGELADETLARGAILLAKAPRSAGHWLAVAQARRAGPLQLVVSQAPGSRGELAARTRELAPGGAIVLAGARDSTPLLAGRGPVNGVDAVYICRGTVCDLPVTSATELRRRLR
ncbi:MAG: hypothetical protein QM673_03930, partial [Gordonia sp. (in: high G+C Gram-positive bacteria)]